DLAVVRRQPVLLQVPGPVRRVRSGEDADEKVVQVTCAVEAVDRDRRRGERRRLAQDVVDDARQRGGQRPRVVRGEIRAAASTGRIREELQVDVEAYGVSDHVLLAVEARQIVL